MYDVISIGGANVDIFAKSNALVCQGPHLCLLRSSKNEMEAGFISSGGGATNTAVSFSRLGLKVGCIARAGSADFLSQYLRSDLKSNHVTDLIAYVPQEATDYSVVLVGPDGSRSIITNRGSTRLEAVNIPWSKLKTQWFYLTSLEGNLDLLEQLIGFAKENSIKVALNPGNREIGCRSQLLPLLSQVDFLLLNRTEAEALTQVDFDQSAFWSSIARTRCPLVAITNGRRGAHILTASDHFFSPIINTTPVDETGAGDSFGSAFVAALTYRHPPSRALHWGLVNAASVVSYLGAKPGLLTLKQITHS
jgi:sugar/nucleoside kinase (ribokinase family)